MPPFDLHDSTEVADIARLIADPEDDRAALLSGEPGSGRRSLFAAAVRQARADGVAVLACEIDLDGYEPGLTSLENFARYQLAKRERDDDPLGLEAVRAIAAGKGEGELPRLLLAAAVLGRDEDSDELARIAASRDSYGWGAWDSLIAAAGDDIRLVVHLLDAHHAPIVARRRLLELPKLKAAFSCRPLDGTPKISRKRPAARFEVMNLDPGEIRVAVAEHAGAEITLEEADRVYARTFGLRSLTAKLAPRIAEDLAAAVADPLAPALDGLNDHDAKLLRSFVHLAALGGENVPVKSLLVHLGVAGDDLDDWIDRIDETIGSDSDLSLFAERFEHPAFPGQPVYGFADSAVSEAFRRALSTEARGRLSGELLSSFARTIPLTTRAAAVLIATLCGECDQTADRQELERELAFWAADADCDELQGELTAEVREGLRSFAQLWTTVNSVQLRWPPSRTLAVLEGAAAAGMPRELQSAYHTMRSGFLIDGGRNQEAVEAAQAGIEIANDQLLESALYERLGAAYRNLGNVQEAEKSYQRSRDLRELLLDQGDRRVFPVIRAYVDILRKAGQEEEASRLEQKASQAESKASG